MQKNSRKFVRTPEALFKKIGSQMFKYATFLRLLPSSRAAAISRLGRFIIPDDNFNVLILRFCMLKLSIITPMKRFSVKKDPNTMNVTKYKYMWLLTSFSGCCSTCQIHSTLANMLVLYMLLLLNPWFSVQDCLGWRTPKLVHYINYKPRTSSTVHTVSVKTESSFAIKSEKCMIFINSKTQLGRTLTWQKNFLIPFK